MCSPVRVESTKDYSQKISTPPPPAKTADMLVTTGDEIERDGAERKKRGTRTLRIYDESVLMIPESAYDTGSAHMLNIPR